MNRSRKILSIVLTASRFVAQQRDRDPRQFERWLDNDFFENARAAPLPASADLRRYRNAQMARIAFRDIAGWATLDETLAALSDLADACCKSALESATAKLQNIHGKPGEAQPVILALGKLGGHELNFSSDIDLIFCFTAAGETAGPRRISNEEYFGKLAQEFTRLLAERTTDGFVFRVDWMLRPFGAAGPPAMSLAAMEEYYQSHGREWERYALIKARPLAGDLAAGEKLLESLRPFVYRRYLDFNAIGHLRELKRKIETDAQRRGLGQDLKLGRGGIREVEFIVQSFQLMRGGQVAALRNNRLRPVLRYLGESRLLEPKTAQALEAAYGLLRRIENAVQLYDDQQTHALPADEPARIALCAALNLENWAALENALNPARERVRREFARIFADAPAPAGSALRQALENLWSGAVLSPLPSEEGRACPELVEGVRDGAAPKAHSALRGVPHPRADARRPLPKAEASLDPQLARALADLRDLPLVKTLSEIASDRLLDALAVLLEDARRQPEPQTAALRALEIAAAVAGRSTYLALLRDSPVAREHLLKLCAASPWLTRLLAHSPGLLDLLLDPRALHAPPGKDELRVELATRARETPPGDTEAAMSLLRRYVQETTLRVAAADLTGVLPLVKVSDRLTWLAEAAVEQALRLAQQNLRLQSGEPRTPDGKTPGLAVIGYGKFGGTELGYGSDLDLVFIHGSTTPDAESVGGKRMLTHAEYFSRWVQRTVNLLSAQTHMGRAYEVDLELRPSGNSGPPVSSLQGFSEYLRREAWTWEHQALTRARFVAGDAGLGAAFEALRSEVICQPRDAQKLRADILEMRSKMQANLDKAGAGKFDVKQGRGGITDIEFITQYLVLRDAHRAPELARWSDNWRQLDALEIAGSVSRAQKETLIAVYRGYRAWLHARSLQSETQVVEDSVFKAEREEVQALWQEILDLSS